MDKRSALSNGYVLNVKSNNNAEQVYKIKSEVARGGSCIVYDATYVNNSGVERLVRVKECYPFKLDLIREADGVLSVKDNEMALFDEYKMRLNKAFDIMNELFNNAELTNVTSNTYDIYVKNNTIYIVSIYVQGNTLSNLKDFSLKDAISVVKTVAKVIREIHKSGYLYLDIKPDNIWVYKETTELIQLFDFDSMLPFLDGEQNRELTDYRISFTKGFAAHELQMGQIDKLGTYTDVYGIGALLFYLIFGHTPSAFERDLYAEYDYSKSLYADKRFQDKLYFELTNFFHKTLSDYYLDRYVDTEPVVERLEKLLELADEKKRFIYSSNLSYDKKVLGRDEEFEELSWWLKDDTRKVIYITGIGGIGKSSIVKAFLANNRAKVDACVYLNYKGDIKRTIINDVQFPINTVERYQGEEESDYFERKLAVVRELAHTEKVLLVIDNYAGEECEELHSLLNTNCKVIFITRREQVYGDFELNIKAIPDEENVRRIFEYYMNKNLSDSECESVRNIIEAIAGHTLVLELIAKQILSSNLTIEEAAYLVKQNGFTNIGQEKIRFAKDDSGIYATLLNIIGAIFDASTMDIEKKAILKAVTLFGTSGIGISDFSKILDLQDLNAINELRYDGWIELQNEILTVHPVICEVIHSWNEDQTVGKYALEIMNHVFKTVRLENHREDYSKKLLKLHQMLQESYEKNKWLKKWYEKNMSKQGVLGEVIKERVERGEDYTISNHELMNKYLSYAESIVMSCQREEDLHSTNIYKDLLYETIIAMPRDREDFIMERSEELIIDKTVSNSITMMKLFDYRVCIFCERHDYDAAWAEIEKAKQFLNNYRCNHSIGQYYEMLSEYYDSKLDGAYETESDEEIECLEALVDSLNKAIKYTKKSHNSYRKELQLIKCLLFKANVLIRSEMGNEKEIDKILDTIQSLIVVHCQSNSTYLKDYYMTCAWYATRMLKNYKATAEFAIKAAEISVKTATSELQVIDEIIIPFAKMLWELEQYEREIAWLDNGIKICEEYPDVIPYIRKKLQLYSCKMNVYYYSGKYDKCRENLVVIDALNKEYNKFGICVDIPDEIREGVK